MARMRSRTCARVTSSERRRSAAALDADELKPRATLPLSFDSNLDEIGPICRDSARHGRCDGVSVLDPDAFDAHAGRQMHEIKLRSRQVHVLIGMLRPGFKCLTPDVHIVLEDAILPV